MQIHRSTQQSFAIILALLVSAGVPPSAARQQTAQGERAAKIAVSPAGDSTAVSPAASQVRVERTLDGLPLYFVENSGQADERVAFYVPGQDDTIYFTPHGVTFALIAPVTPPPPRRSPHPKQVPR